MKDTSTKLTTCYIYALIWAGFVLSYVTLST